MLPSIIFKAELSVNKLEFHRRRGSMMLFAVFGTFFSSMPMGATVYILLQYYYSSKYVGDTPIPLLESLVFGAIISSIDPVAILSVLKATRYMTRTPHPKQYTVLKKHKKTIINFAITAQWYATKGS